ncbi:hypothetical protein GQE99_18555 [Maritimibacter sp. DP07]|uniref:Uncharacterized protein n=1 Tax=Maritimibacter harenae TaxID=2606218 RepID=A0A845M4S0_9RHOB|nr:hypothetical protein [Maritimibacter harenae]MZR15025.1 hypothetical protein [Maritimibacter harenae]
MFDLGAGNDRIRDFAAEDTLVLTGALPDEVRLSHADGDSIVEWSDVRIVLEDYGDLTLPDIDFT